MKGHVQNPVALAVSDEFKSVVQNRLGRPQRESGGVDESKRRTMGTWWVIGWERNRRMLKELHTVSWQRT